VAGKLDPLVPGEGSGELCRKSKRVGGESFSDVFCGPVVDLDEYPEPGGTLDQGRDRAGAVLADDQVAFPVTGHSPVVGLAGSFRDVDHPDDLRPPMSASTPRHSPGATRAQTRR
jgi:hypothetical protein